MILKIYLIILGYFILGGLGFYIIGKRKDIETARYNRNKYISYFLIIHVLFFSIIFNPLIFHYIAIIIVVGGLTEVVRLFARSGFSNKKFFSLLMVAFVFLSGGFICFSLMERNMILFTFLIIAVFDSFSQISGQIFGKRKLMPSISPGKTIEGLAGGAVIAILSALLLNDLTYFNSSALVMLAIGLVLSAFLGDMVTSLYKRRYRVKDFSNLIPGHGGILDRFDSFIAGATFVTLLDFFGI